MDTILIILPLALLMFVAYRGFSVILFAPLTAMLAVLLVNPTWVPAYFTGIFMDKLAGFVRLYFPVFLLGALFGKLIEISGFARTITHAIIRLIGKTHAILAIVLVGAILTYGGVSLFVVAFALYPFASDLFKKARIPKRLIPGTIALGAFTFTMDSLPGTPQIQNIIPTTFFNTDTWAAPWLGIINGIIVFSVGMIYLNWQQKRAARSGEDYGTNHKNEPTGITDDNLPNLFIAILPLFIVALSNKLLGILILEHYQGNFDFAAVGVKGVSPIDISKVSAIWAVSGALLAGIISVIGFSFQTIKSRLSEGLTLSVGGAMLATLNTASEYGFGGVIAALPGFKTISSQLATLVDDPLVNEAVTTTALAGITGSASGGLSIALATMSETYLRQAGEYGISPEVLHRIASIASGGMDTLPHNGAVITVLAITGLTHKQSYKDIFAITLIKTFAVFVVIAVYYLTGIE